MALTFHTAWIVLSATIAISAIGLSGDRARAIPIQPQPLVEFSVDKQGTLFVSWTGPVVPGMADFLRTTYEKHASTARTIVLHLDSVGGDVEEGERAIEVLRRVKAAGHRVITFVANGDICASMCVSLYLAGSERVAGIASVWCVHQAARIDEDGKVHLDQAESIRLFKTYYLPAGVSARWLKSITQALQGNNLWFSGGDLVRQNSGIVTRLLGNSNPRTDSA